MSSEAVFRVLSLYLGLHCNVTAIRFMLIRSICHTKRKRGCFMHVLFVVCCCCCCCFCWSTTEERLLFFSLEILFGRMTKCELPCIQEKSVGILALNRIDGEFIYQSEPVMKGLSQLGASLNPFFFLPNPLLLFFDLSSSNVDHITWATQERMSIEIYWTYLNVIILMYRAGIWQYFMGRNFLATSSRLLLVSRMGSPQGNRT